MSLLGFGQPQTGVFQMAYVVDDITRVCGGSEAIDHDAEVARHLEHGHELAFQAWVPTGGRVGYVDTTAELPGYLELIEMDEATDTAFTRFYAASLGWDGSDPVRPFA